ncbi:hypothetical protein ACH3XW_25965 [Acanthocheilonema viteae]|uniref:Uncharacterized protein n=1 Tax=Acanthocheilonema viteae TaxID=6277 RepID=A0A498S5T2_ACAVI|nr:unnamed protein product [Acanthocheilonema viteae]
MHLVVEKYRTEHNTSEPLQPILVPFKRYSRECVVSAIMEFINYNFIMDSPPKYRDFEGDMILLETREAFEVALDDVMQTPQKLFVVHIDGVYKSESPKKEDAEMSMITEASSLCGAYNMKDLEIILMDRMVEEVKQEVNKQIVKHPVIHKVAEFMNGLKQKTYGASCSKQKSTQTSSTDVFDATDSSSSTFLEGQSSSRISEDDIAVFQLIDESPVWDVKAIYERKTISLTKWESPSSSDLVQTLGEGEGIFSKRWVLHRFPCRGWQNVSVINEKMPAMLEIYRSKMIVTNLPEKGQIVDFTVWVKCSAPTGYFCASWQLYKMTENGRDSIPEGPRLTFEIFLNPFTDKNVDIERPTVPNELDLFSYYAAVKDGEQNVDDTRELEELTSSGSISASDYEVIDGGDAVDDSETK